MAAVVRIRRDPRLDRSERVFMSEGHETLYEHAGGDEGLHRLEEIFYAKALADPVLKRVFTKPVPTHVDHLTWFTAESFGGPDRFTRTLGFQYLIDKHRHLNRVRLFWRDLGRWAERRQMPRDHGGFEALPVIGFASTRVNLDKPADRLRALRPGLASAEPSKAANASPDAGFSCAGSPVITGVRAHSRRAAPS
jgi:truncated hemoglobin YjbI